MNRKKRFLFDEIADEIARAILKFPTWPTDPIHAMSVVSEESGELTKSVLECVYEPEKSSVDDVRIEAIQVAAMAVRFLLSLDGGVYTWVRCGQHRQEGGATDKE